MIKYAPSKVVIEQVRILFEQIKEDIVFTEQYTIADTEYSEHKLNRQNKVITDGLNFKIYNYLNLCHSTFMKLHVELLLVVAVFSFLHRSSKSITLVFL